MAGNHFEAPQAHLCGHTEIVRFDSSPKARAEDRRYYQNTLCGQCRGQVKQAMAGAPADGKYHIEMLPIVGRGGQVKWGTDLRNAAFKKAEPLMAHLEESDAPYAKLALASLVMLFKVHGAKFWIDNRRAPYDSEWVISEIEVLMRKSSSSVRPSSCSAYLFWFSIDGSVIRAAKEALVTVPEAYMLVSHPAPETVAQAPF